MLMKGRKGCFREEEGGERRKRTREKKKKTRGIHYTAVVKRATVLC